MPSLITTHANRAAAGPAPHLAASLAMSAPEPAGPPGSKHLPDSKRLLHALLACLDDAKAEDVVALDLAGRTTLADSMVVASGRSGRHVAAVAERALEALREAGVKGARVEGLTNAEWVVVDAGDVILHLFQPDVRLFYNLEKVWGADRPAEGASEGAGKATPKAGPRAPNQPATRARTRAPRHRAAE